MEQSGVGVTSDEQIFPVSVPPSTSTQDSDAAALLRVAGGDFGAFEELVDRYKTRLFRHIRRRIAEEHKAEDPTQEVFLRLFRAARSGGYRSGQSRVVTWLFTIAGNCVTDQLRAESARSAVRGARVEAESEDPHDAAAAREGEWRVRQLLLELPDAQRQVVELHVLDGLSFADVAELVGAPVPTVKSRLVYALRKLKRSMDDSRGNES